MIASHIDIVAIPMVDSFSAAVTLFAQIPTRL
jgi:hypothetical protein